MNRCTCLCRTQVGELREALGTVEVNMVTNLVDPYCVAMATKTKVVSGETTRERERGGWGRVADWDGTFSPLLGRIFFLFNDSW